MNLSAKRNNQQSNMIEKKNNIYNIKVIYILIAHLMSYILFLFYKILEKLKIVWLMVNFEFIIFHSRAEPGLNEREGGHSNQQKFNAIKCI